MNNVNLTEEPYPFFHFQTHVGQLLFDLYLDEGFLHAQHYEWGQELSHNHAAFEVHLILKGHCVMYVDNTYYRLNKGDCCVIPPGRYHSQLPSPEDTVEKTCFRFHYQVLPGPTPRASNEETQALNEILLGMNFHIQHNAKEYLFLVSEIMDELQTKSVGFIAQIENLFSQLLIRVIRSSPSATLTTYTLPQKTPDDLRMDRIEAFFWKNYKGQLGEEDLARSLNVSTRQLNRILNELYGLSFRQKIVNTRLEIAMDLLHNTDLTINQIAEHIGYQTPSNFHSAFKTNLGITPSTFKKQASSNSPSLSPLYKRDVQGTIG